MKWALGCLCAALVAGCGDDGGSGEGGSTTTSTSMDPTSADGSTTTTEPGTGSSESGPPVECIDDGIQGALDAAGEGDTVTLCDGTHDLVAALRIPPGVTLAGESRAGTIVQQQSDLGDAPGGAVIIFMGGHVGTLTTLTLQGPADGDQAAAIWVEGSDSVTISDVEVHDFARVDAGVGVMAVGAVSGLTVENSLFEHNWRGVATDGAGGVSGNAYNGNTFVDQLDTAVFTGSNTSGTQVVGNMIMQTANTTEDGDGIALQGVTDFLIDGNTIDMGPQENARHGILVNYIYVESMQNAVTGTISNNTMTNVGNGPDGNSESGLRILGNHAQVTSHNIVLMGNTAVGDNMGNALIWQSPGGTIMEPTEIPDQTLSYP